MIGNQEHEEVKEQLFAYRENLLNPQERSRVEEHLRECPECREEWAELQAFEARLREDLRPRAGDDTGQRDEQHAPDDVIFALTYPDSKLAGPKEIAWLDHVVGCRRCRANLASCCEAGSEVAADASQESDDDAAEDAWERLQGLYVSLSIILAGEAVRSVLKSRGLRRSRGTSAEALAYSFEECRVRLAVARVEERELASVTISVSSETLALRDIEIKMTRNQHQVIRKGDAEFYVDALGPGEYTATLCHAAGNRLLGAIAISIEA